MYENNKERPPEVPGEYKRETVYGYEQPRYQTGGSEEPAWEPQAETGGQPPRRERKKRSRKAVAFVVAIACVLSAALGGLIGYQAQSGDEPPRTLPVAVTSDVNAQQVVNTASQPLAGEDLSVSDIYKRVSPAAVSISTRAVGMTMYGRAVETGGSGSGFIVSDDGYIVTNNHVVEGANHVTVVTEDGEEYSATVIGTDPATDIAVIKISAKNLPTVLLGNSDAMEIGEQVVAIGNPLGTFSNSVTVGYLSGLNRELTFSDGKIGNLMQVDAAINPGNSGGALVNMRGEVIGINTAKSSGTGVEGLGFAIPVNDVIPIIEDLMNRGYVSRPFIGISTQDVSQQTAAAYGVPTGVIIVEVQSGSPAEKAGLRANDIITEFAGETISVGSDLTAARNARSVGDTVTVRFYRDGSQQEVELVLGESIAAN